MRLGFSTFLIIMSPSSINSLILSFGLLPTDSRIGFGILTALLFPHFWMVACISISLHCFYKVDTIKCLLVALNTSVVEPQEMVIFPSSMQAGRCWLHAR
jgi:hypothetical protein